MDTFERVCLYTSLFLILGVLFIVGGRLDKLENKPAQRECLDYTMREIRAGDSPEKCGPELFTDSVTE